MGSATTWRHLYNSRPTSESLRKTSSSPAVTGIGETSKRSIASVPNAPSQRWRASSRARTLVRIAATTWLAKRKLLSEPQVEAVLLDTLPSATLLNGLTNTLRLAGAHPTPAVRRKLLWCTLHGNDDIRVHAAALVHFLYGVAASSFDWEFRPLYLRFGSRHLAERRQAYLELCASIHVNPTWALDNGDEN